MKFLNWITNRGKDTEGEVSVSFPAKNDREVWTDRTEWNAERNDGASSARELPYIFHEPFDHLHIYMSESERKIFDVVEARWRKRYEQCRYYPPMSEGMEQEDKVFKAIDNLQWALHDRQHAPFDDWKMLEAKFEDAVAGVRKAFCEQRRFVEKECDISLER